MGKIVVPEYNLWDIEGIAEEFLAEYWRPAELPVDIEAIAERDLGIDIDFRALGSPVVVGSICRRPHDGRLVIIVQEEWANRNPNRYRFTVAQEVSHLRLHRDLIEGVQTLDQARELHDSLSATQQSVMERDANSCAAAILMPQRRFRRSAEEAYETWFQRISSVTKVVPNLLLKRITDSLARAFGVSFQAAEIRLRKWPLKLEGAIIGSAKRHQKILAAK